jgi:6-phosphogluconolactonase
MIKWLVLSDAQAIAEKATEIIIASAHLAIEAKNDFKWITSGGSTPKLTYQNLVNTQQDWHKWHLFYGDERCVPPPHSERNSLMIEQSGLICRGAKHHQIPAELGAEIGAKRYGGMIAKVSPFDLVLLGMGEDGHTASLFPNDSLDLEAWAVAVHHAPKPPADRVSLGIRALQQCKQMLVLVSGENKQSAVKRWQAGEKLPIAQVTQDSQVTVLLDKAASP